MAEAAQLLPLATDPAAAALESVSSRQWQRELLMLLRVALTNLLKRLQVESGAEATPPMEAPLATVAAAEG